MNKFFTETLAQEDPEITHLISQELKRQQDHIELIASENIVSKAVLQAMGSVFTNKYAEGYPGKRYYHGCEFADGVEELARERLKKLFNAAFVNVQPHSGSQANAAVYMALLQPGDTVMGLSLDAGGHLTHGAKVSSSGKYYNAIQYGVNAEGLIDYDAVLTLAREHQPKLIITGGSAYARLIDFKRFREIADSVGAYLMVDMAHFAGLVAGKQMPNPLDCADVVTSTTHKTLRGPRGGIILLGKDFENPWGLTTPKGQVKMMASLDELMAKIPDSARRAQWKYDASLFTDTTALIIAPNYRYTSSDIARYISNHQKVGTMQNLSDFIHLCYTDFLDSVSIAYADSQLEKEYPEFAQVVDEYRRGLMIFNYNDAMIWHKALNDSVGFTDFYARESATKRLDNPDDSIYFFHPRARITVIDVADDNLLDANKAQSIIAKAQKKNMGSNEMKQQLVKKINRKNYPNGDKLIKIDIEQVEQTRQNILQNDQWQRGVYLQDNGAGYRIVVVEEVLPRSIKPLMDARGYYLNAWQNEVERQLNDELRQKYNVKIHRDVVRTLTF